MIRASQYLNNFHFCQHCSTDFRIDMAEAESGDFFLVCPACRWKHYRRFENGVAVHCDLRLRKSEPVEVFAKGAAHGK